MSSSFLELNIKRSTDPWYNPVEWTTSLIVCGLHFSSMHEWMVGWMKDREDIDDGFGFDIILHVFIQSIGFGESTNCL